MPRLLIGLQYIAHRLSPIQFGLGQVPAKLFNTTIVVISDVGVGLAQLLGNLGERVTFKEVQPERVSLIRRQVLYDLLPSIPTEKPFDRMVVVCSFIVGLAAFVRFVCDSGQIESLRLQSPSAQEGLRIGYLH